MKNGGIIRFLLVCVICFAVVFYNGARFISFPFIKEEKNILKTENFFYDDTIPLLNTEQNEDIKEEKKETQSETVQSEKKEETSEQVSASAVKGKIISQYISPYNAPLSYSKVYMKNSTDLDVNIKKLLSDPLSFKIEKSSKPQVLIIHTHTTETYMSDDSEYYTEDFKSRSTDNSRNMAKIGSIVAEKLNNAGIKTIHDKTQHDYPQYSGSYGRAAKTINSYLKKYPDIKIVLDLHRDAVTSGESDKVKLVTEIEGKKAAQVMLVMGSQSGTVTNFPNWKENLKLAVRLQQTFEKKYPTLARPLSLMPKNYNQSLTKGSLLIEFGTDANSLEEAEYSASLVGDCLVSLLNNLE